MTAVGQINAAKIRSGHCWECGQPLTAIPTLLERWKACDRCRRRFLILSDLLLIERIQVDPELVGIEVETLLAHSAPIISWEGASICDGLVPADAWFESALESEPCT